MGSCEKKLLYIFNMVLKLTYFPFPGRAHPIRAAFKIGGVEFEDVQLSWEEITKLFDGRAPFRAVPILTLENGETISQSNAILRYVGNLGSEKLYPTDDAIAALKVDEILDAVEDIGNVMTASIKESDPEKKIAMRKAMVTEEGALTRWLQGMEVVLKRNDSSKNYCVGDSLTIADLKLVGRYRQFVAGTLDGIPKDVLDAYPRTLLVMQTIHKA